jgi:hypothetical protein
MNRSDAGEIGERFTATGKVRDGVNNMIECEFQNVSP